MSMLKTWHGVDLDPNPTGLGVPLPIANRGLHAHVVPHVRSLVIRRQHLQQAAPWLG